MFIDKVRIYVQGGTGGSGCLSFRREKYIPMGGPNGGNGGRGGDVYLVSTKNMTTLLDLTYRPHFKAHHGEHGQSWDRSGKGGKSIDIQVPCGTVVIQDGKILGDLTQDKQRILVAHGGRGGRGNAAFKTSRNSAPRISEKGEPGEMFEIDLELKMIADVGLIGCPNAGKSTLLSRISKAKPKIADYPFTTLTPNLGVAQYKSFSFVVADIPGLIEGAHQGKGLGIGFLRHIERTRMLVHLVDMTGFSGKSVSQDYRSIQKEIQLYSKKLARKPVIIVATKMDCTGSEDQLKKFKKSLKGKKVISISAVTGLGLETLFSNVVEKLKSIKPQEDEDVITPEVGKFQLTEEIHVVREDDAFRVSGKKIERLVAMTHFNQEESLSRFLNILKKMGVDKKLEKLGCVDGDPIRIRDMEFTYNGAMSSQGDSLQG